jgi:hypothetical protein
MYIIKKNVSWDQKREIVCGIFTDDHRAFAEYFRQCSENYSWLIQGIFLYEKIDGKEILLSSVKFGKPSNKNSDQIIAAVLAIANV